MSVSSPLSAVAQSERLMDFYNEYRMNLEAGNLQIALIYAERTFELAESELGHDRALVADRIVDLAAVEAQLGELRDASKHYRNAIDLYEQALGRDNERIVRPLQALADVYTVALNMEDASKTHLRAINLLQRHVGSDHVNTAIALWNYADFLALQEETVEDALAAITRAENILDRADNVPSLARVQLYATKGSILSKVGHVAEALASFERAESIAAEDDVTVDTEFLNDLYLDLAQANGKLGKNKVARDYFFMARPGEPAAIPVYQPKPGRPRSTAAELRLNMDGQALVSFTITLEGKTRDIQVISASPDSSFGVAARRNVAEWAYLPPFTEEGRNVEVFGVRELIQFHEPDPGGPGAFGSVDYNY